MTEQGQAKRVRFSTLALWCATSFLLGVLLTYLISLAPWGEHGGIDPEAWLGFWGTLLSAALAGGVAALVLASQLRKQEEHLQITFEVQRDEARKEREIQALSELNAVLVDGYSGFPSDGRRKAMESGDQELMSAVANWQMNWGIDSAEDLEVDWQIDTAATALRAAYSAYKEDAMYLDEVVEIHNIFSSWTRSISSYVNSSQSDRRARLIELGDNLQAAEGALVREYLLQFLQPPSPEG